MKSLRIHQPIHFNDNFPPHKSTEGGVFILRPAAFLWYAGKLYVGYAFLSCLHHDEEPCWDNVPVPVGATIDAFYGYFRFKKVIQAQGRCSYAVIEFHDLVHPKHFWSKRYNKSIHENVTKRTPRLHERFILEPGMILYCQRWTSSIPLLVKKWGGRKAFRRVMRSPSMEQMRNVDPQLRKEVEELFPTNIR